MADKIHLSTADVQVRAASIAQRIIEETPNDFGTPSTPVALYGIPRGGVPAVYAVAMVLDQSGYSCGITENLDAADVIIDDIVDTGETRNRVLAAWKKESYRCFYALVDKTREDALLKDSWFVFPWETSDDTAGEGIQDNIRRTLQFIGEDPTREGLLETPARVEKALLAMTDGYGKSGPDILKSFEDGAFGYDEIIAVRNIPFYSKCEHHMEPFWGTATVGYIPDGRVVGLSKMSRLIDMFAHRLQVQERMTRDIARVFDNVVRPKGVGVVVHARHMCMEARGVCKRGSVTSTAHMLGDLKEGPLRAEFLALAQHTEAL